MPERVYLNRRSGEERIHVEIDASEIADILEDFADENPTWCDATKNLRRVLVQAGVDLRLTHN